MKLAWLSLILGFSIGLLRAEPRDEVLGAAMTFAETHWDERAGLLWAPAPVRQLPGPVHQIRQSVWYALGLLQRNAPGDEARARRIFDVVLRQQIHAPGWRWNGTFYRYPEEPAVPVTAREFGEYDPNWRQFVGTSLALALEEFPDRLPAALRVRLLEAVVAAAAGEVNEPRIEPFHTNVALMNAFLVSYAGVKGNRPDLVAEGGRLLDDLAARIDEHGTVWEYNSPTYYGVDIFALALWRKHGPSERMRGLGARWEAELWRETARYYHAGMRNLCGPFDRAYGMDMPAYAGLIGLWMRLSVLGDAAPFPPLGKPMAHAHDFSFAPAFALAGTVIPEDAMVEFKAFSGERSVRRELPEGRIATAWLAPTVMAGGEISGRTRHTGGTASANRPATVHWLCPDGRVGWIALIASPRVDAEAGPHRLDVTGVGDFVFRVHAPGWFSIEGNIRELTLPGLRVGVQSDAQAVALAAQGEDFDLTFTAATNITFEIEPMP